MNKEGWTDEDVEHAVEVGIRYIEGWVAGLGDQDDTARKKRDWAYSDGCKAYDTTLKAAAARAVSACTSIADLGQETISYQRDESLYKKHEAKFLGPVANKLKEALALKWKQERAKAAETELRMQTELANLRGEIAWLSRLIAASGALYMPVDRVAVVDPKPITEENVFKQFKEAVEAYGVFEDSRQQKLLAASRKMLEHLSKAGVK